MRLKLTYMQTSIKSLSLSLADIAGKEYIGAVCAARSALDGTKPRALLAIANEKVELYPQSFARQLDRLLPLVGTRVCDGLPSGSRRGAPTDGFRKASKAAPSPLSGMGLFRV